MFILSALVKMINTNKDDLIQKEEVQSFIQKQNSPSIFNDYFNSINEEINVNEFENQMAQIAEENYQKTGKDPSVDFKDKKYNEEYERCSLETINGMRYDAYMCYGYKAENKEAFNLLFTSLLKEAAKEGNINLVYEKLEQLEISKPVTMQYIQESGVYDVKLPSGVPLSGDIDWSNQREILNYLCFDETTFSNTPKEHLPEGYDPKQIFDLGKTSGLGIDEVHAMGYTGEGVSFAMIDSGALCEDGYNEDGTRKFAKHEGVRYAGYQEAPSSNSQWINHFHGLATSYIAQEIAPKADFYYYAANNGGGEATNTEVLESLRAILEKNKSLPDDKKIRFVSMSMPLYGGEEAKQIAAELEAQGVWIYYSGCSEDNRTGYLGKKDPMGDPNDFNNYQIENGSRIDILPDGTVDTNIKENLLYINSGNRTVPDPSSPNAFRHDPRASQSWSVPVLAGYYTLACQADPSMTKEKFMRLAEETAQIKPSTLPQSKCVGDPNNEYDWRPAGRSEQTTNIKIIDIKALLQAIENEKSQQAQ